MLTEILGFFSTLLTTTRGRITIALLIATGIASITLGVVAVGAAWLAPVQTLLVLAFVIGTVFVYTPPEQYLRNIAIAAPAVGAVVLGFTVLPGYLWLLLGAGVGWVIAGVFLFRQQTPREVVRAVRQMRKGHYKEAVAEMNEIIKRDQGNPEHYRLRAMILRLDGQLGRAKRDYESMLQRAPADEAGDAIRAEAYDGLAEVHLQAGRYAEADAAASQAHALYPQNWVPLYNLGLINDRLARPEQTVDYLARALDMGIPDQRQRLLAHLYLARAYQRLGDNAAAQEHIEDMSHMWKGLEGLQTLIGDEQSAPLAAVLADDVATAHALMTDEMTAGELA